jgi:phosphoglycerate dehydrogenase-like enzyme
MSSSSVAAVFTEPVSRSDVPIAERSGVRCDARGVTEQRADVLFCSDTFLDLHGTELDCIAPDLERVVLAGEDVVSQEDIDRITLAFFSHDVWPERTAPYMSVALQAPNLRWFHTMSAGVDHPVFMSMVDRGVHLTTSSGSSASPIAGTVLMYLLALSRDLPRMLRAQQDARWDWKRWNELAGRSVAVVGYGPIGQEVVRLVTAIGMAPVIVRREPHGDEPCATRPLGELIDVAGEVDAVVVALPLNDHTREIISADVIAAMQPHAFFVNVGRGELVDQEALTDALESRAIAGAGLDVTDPEPLPSEHRLWGLPNVIITPHSSGSSDGTSRRAAEAFLTNLGRLLGGEPLRNEVTR